MPELAVSPRGVQIVVADQRTMFGDEAFEAVLSRARRFEIDPAVAVQVQSGVHAKQRLVAVGIHVAQLVGSEQAHGLRAQPHVERIVPDDADVGLRACRSRGRCWIEWPGSTFATLVSSIPFSDLRRG